MVAEIETMHQIRQSGATLQEIGSLFGISREGVRRRLTRHYSSTRIQGLLTVADLGRLAGCTYSYINKLRRGGIIQPAKVVGRSRTLWEPATVATIIMYNDSHRCPVCQRPVPSNRHVYCSSGCYIEIHRYKNKPEQEKRQHNERVARWMAAHPEQVKQTEQRKAKKRSARRYQNTQYQISRKCPIPVGTVVRVVSGNKDRGTLNVEWGDRILEIPWGCVKKLTQGLTKG